jgi:hypothetical protein
MRCASAFLILVSAAGPASAHHSLVGYDHGRRLELAGTVAEFHFTQPHPYLVLAARSGRWKLEMDNLWELQEIGLTRESFKPADKVTVSGSPDREGAKALYLWRLDRPSDGLHYEQVGSRPHLSFKPRS